ncbi:glycosyltransferase [Methyloceanibacter sp.]|uniref:glycosyltransferase n=1 Tax=Methyloceanibacter sp. TaxID=1965321 RepID=UPI002D3169BF|nr:glycosyltransferase [Methyloceanibacter sp.]HZP09578.1 glycosyltransferase [Methyloceanibacter sp.]
MPDKDSGSRSAFSYLQILSRAGFQVTFVPADLRPGGAYGRALRRLGVKIVSAPQWTTLPHVIESLAPCADLLLLFRAPVAAQVFGLIRTIAPSASILFNTVDLHFLRMEREAELDGNEASKDEALEVRRLELDLINRSDAAIVVSSYERDLLRELAPQASVHRIPILREMPRGSLLERLRWRACSLFRAADELDPSVKRRDLDFRRRSALLFIGGFDHTPNVDAVKWFVGEVWPLLQSRGFPHRLIIAGSNMPDDVAALASDRIEARGYVKDLGRLYAACRVSIAPIRYGAGMKGKIVESLGYGVPVVATSMAAEGMDLRHNETVLIADSPVATADEILRAYDDDGLWQVLSNSGYRHVESHFSLAAGARVLLPLVDDLIARSRAKRKAQPLDATLVQES